MLLILIWSLAQDWFNILEHYTRLNATISDLIMGNTYTFRIFAENKCGLSEECARTKEEATIVKEGETFSTPPLSKNIPLQR